MDPYNCVSRISPKNSKPSQESKFMGKNVWLKTEQLVAVKNLPSAAFSGAIGDSGGALPENDFPRRRKGVDANGSSDVSIDTGIVAAREWTSLEKNEHEPIFTFLSAAIGQITRNNLNSCCCCCCSSPFGSFPLKNKFKWKKFLPSWESNRGPLAPKPSTLLAELWQHWYKLLENYIFKEKTTPQTLDQYWSTLVPLPIRAASLAPNKF